VPNSHVLTNDFSDFYNVLRDVNISGKVLIFDSCEVWSRTRMCFRMFDFKQSVNFLCAFSLNFS